MDRTSACPRPPTHEVLFVSNVVLWLCLLMSNLAWAADVALVQSLARHPKANQKIDIHLHRAQVVHVLRAIAQAGDIDVVTTPAVQGRLHLRLHQVRWVEALASVLDSRGLVARLEGRILFVETAEERARRDEQALARTQAQQALAPLLTRVYPVSYAKAADLAPMVSALLGPRGTVSVDARTNTLIVTTSAPEHSEVQGALRRPPP